MAPVGHGDGELVQLMLLTITDDGRQVLLQRRAAWHAVLGSLLENWSDQDVRDFAGFLDRFVEPMAG